MSTDTLWSNRRPGEMASRVIDPDTGQPLRDLPDSAMVIMARWIDSDAFQVPHEVAHPAAGQRVRVSCSFLSLDPLNPQDGRMVAHLWAEREGIGVCESPSGFGCYLLTDWPADWPREQYRRRPS